MLHNKRTDPMRKETIDMLQKFYRPQNKRLEELLGVPMGWDYNWRESKNSTKTIEYCIHQQQFSVTRSTTSSHRGSWIIMVLPKYFKDAMNFAFNIRYNYFQSNPKMAPSYRATMGIAILSLPWLWSYHLVLEYLVWPRSGDLIGNILDRNSPP